MTAKNVVYIYSAIAASAVDELFVLVSYTGCTSVAPQVPGDTPGNGS